MRTIGFLAAALMLAATGASAQRVREDQVPYHCTLICTGSIPPLVAVSASTPALPSASLVQPRSHTPRSLDDVFAAARGDATDQPIRLHIATVTSPACTMLVLVPRPCDRAVMRHEETRQ